MLVLSRRAGERIVFPTIGVTVHLLRINGQVARVGIDAPPGIRILREEIADAPPPAGRAAAPDPAHQLCNRLSKVTLALHLFERQRAAGLAADAEATLSRAFDALAALDREAVAGLLAGRTLPPLPPPPPPAVPPAAAKVLLVEDDPNERELLAGLLRMNGCECTAAADGAEALRHLRANERPDVVLLDMLMPVCDGPTALRAIRAERRLAGLTVFGVSGTSPRELGVPTGPDGVDGWFPKPLNPRTLWDAVQRCASSRATVN